MAQMYDCDSSLRVPLDGRFWLGLMWLAAIALLGVDTLDGHPGIMSAWAILAGLGGATWTCAVLHAYSRRVVLDVMSFEHRQQMLAPGEPVSVTVLEG